MTEHKRITGRELISKILDHPAWLDLPVHVLVMDDGDDGGFLNTVEADRFELDGPDVLSLISEKPVPVPAGSAPGCCTACDGEGSMLGEPCSDCLATGHPHDGPCPAAAPAELREDPYAGWSEKQHRALYEQTPPPIELDDGAAAPVEPREDTGGGRG